jgi:hypothetical protein
VRTVVGLKQPIERNNNMRIVKLNLAEKTGYIWIHAAQLISMEPILGDPYMTQIIVGGQVFRVKEKPEVIATLCDAVVAPT